LSRVRRVKSGAISPALGDVLVKLSNMADWARAAEGAASKRAGIARTASGPARRGRLRQATC
jgi:hypothetical protein